VDVITSLLDGPRAREAFLLRSVMQAPWCLRIEDEAPLTIAALTAGTAWFGFDDGEAAHLAAGDVAIMHGPDPYTVADDLSTRPQITVHPGQRCTSRDGTDMAEQMRLGVRTWGNAADGDTTMLTGTYMLDGAVSERLLRALPRLIVVRSGEWTCPVIPLLADEIIKDEPGQEAVLDRLLDLLLVAVLRAWFARPDAAVPAWYRALADPVVGKALQLLHHNPIHGWTVDGLAREVGLSRAALGKRFTELVGEPPMTFLTGWRIALAADLLLQPGATIGSVAPRVGYASPYALSTAFKRTRGVSPKQHRAARQSTSR
jgi:AraC-like DNA-binding protein